MDKENYTPESNQENDWLDEILGKQNVPKELGPDELAVSAAGLTHPDDAELERIVQETMAENWGDDSQSGEPEQAIPTAEPLPEIEADALPAEEEDSPAPVRKQRPKAKDTYGLLGIPHLLATVIWALIILFIGSSLGQLAWVCAADVLALGKEPQEITITIDEGDKIGDVAVKLQKSGMIRYAPLFEAFADLTGKGENILTGSITFNGSIVYDYNALINAMSYRNNSRETVEVMIPEGYCCAQIFALLEEKGVCTAKDLEEAAISAKFEDYWWLNGISRDHKYCLEGFLFPDTYEFYVDDEAPRVLTKFLDNFDSRFSQRMIDKFAALDQRFIRKFSIYEVLILASIVEKESANAAESYTIASVFYNRLTHAASFPYINSDATILYATDYRNKGELTTDELINASPYNTYTKTGLPPTPISNPGLSSLDAALDPEDTDYYYFIFDKSAGVHRFSRTLSEHNNWAAQLGY